MRITSAGSRTWHLARIISSVFREPRDQLRQWRLAQRQRWLSGGQMFSPWMKRLALALPALALACGNCR